MPLADHPELFWLTATVAMTALLWLPYIFRFITEIGVRDAIWDPDGEHPLKSPWAQRAHRAHQNAVENLVVFAPLAIMIHVLGLSSEATATAAMTYFGARAAHYPIYLFGVPVARTLVFLVAWGCQLVMVLALFGVM